MSEFTHTSDDTVTMPRITDDAPTTQPMRPVVDLDPAPGAVAGVPLTAVPEAIAAAVEQHADLAEDLTRDQIARLATLEAVRPLLTSHRIGATTPPDITDLIRLATWVLYGVDTLDLLLDRDDK